jgi:hypothetical protein
LRRGYGADQRENPRPTRASWRWRCLTSLKRPSSTDTSAWTPGSQGSGCARGDRLGIPKARHLSGRKHRPRPCRRPWKVRGTGEWLRFLHRRHPALAAPRLGSTPDFTRPGFPNSEVRPGWPARNPQHYRHGPGGAIDGGQAVGDDIGSMHHLQGCVRGRMQRLGKGDKEVGAEPLDAIR